MFIGIESAISRGTLWLETSLSVPALKRVDRNTDETSKWPDIVSVLKAVDSMRLPIYIISRQIPQRVRPADGLKNRSAVRVNTGARRPSLGACFPGPSRVKGRATNRMELTTRVPAGPGAVRHAARRGTAHRVAKAFEANGGFNADAPAPQTQAFKMPRRPSSM